MYQYFNMIICWQFIYLNRFLILKLIYLTNFLFTWLTYWLMIIILETEFKEKFKNLQDIDFVLSYLFRYIS